MGGWAGFISYDLCSAIETLPITVSNDINMPTIHFAFYDTLIAWDHQRQIGYLLALSYDSECSSATDRLENIRNIYKIIHR